MKARPSTRQDVRDLLTTLTSPLWVPTVVTSSWAEIATVMSALPHSRTFVAGDALTVTPPPSAAGFPDDGVFGDAGGPGREPMLDDAVGLDDATPTGCPGPATTAGSLVSGRGDPDGSRSRAGVNANRAAAR